MNTVGYLFILVALLIVRGVSKGRSLTQLPGDLGAMFTALVSSDQATLAAVLARTGTSADPTTITSADPTTITQGAPGSSTNPNGSAPGTSAGGSTSSRLLARAHTLADAAGGRYVYNTAGPSSYDCSGLVWASMRAEKLTTASRFSTYTFTRACSANIKATTDPQVGDVVLWPSHMGIVDGPGTMYSALSSHYGIIHSPISWGGSSTPTYWRMNTAASGPTLGRQLIPGTTTRTNVPVGS